jgi:hypothetical protein
VKHHTSPRFWEYYRGLPAAVRAQADKSFARLKTDPAHPSLHLKQIGRFWCVRIGIHYRALAVEASDGLVWFWIGSHSDYDRLLR